MMAAPAALVDEAQPILCCTRQCAKCAVRQERKGKKGIIMTIIDYSLIIINPVWGCQSLRASTVAASRLSILRASALAKRII